MAEGTGPDGMDIRVMSRDDLERALSWAAQEGWNPGLADAGCFHAADPAGFLMEFVEGRPTASISVVRYADAFGFLGLYIVRPEARGRGYGFRLWQAGLAHLDGCTVGLDGVIAQQANYARSGFALLHRNLRFAGPPTGEAPAGAELQAVSAKLVPQVVAFDRARFPAQRTRFLECWLHAEGHRALAVVRDGAVSGYGVIRRCGRGSKIGPLFAEREEDADILFRALAAGASGPVILDVPEPNPAALALAERHGLALEFETARMYRGVAPDLPLGQIYGITSFELG
jgi:GNAT superfamily N-acetyltransferase